MIWLLIFLLLLAGAFYLLVRQPPFGSLPRGVHLQRVRQSPHYRKGAFQNPEPTPVMVSRTAFFKTLVEFARRGSSAGNPILPIPAMGWRREYEHAREALLIWFGHSSYFLRIDGVSVLVDPVFSAYASPFSFGSKAFAGTEIFRVTDFNSIDVVLITHDHYDHLDHATIVALQSKTRHFITSLGVGAHLERWGVPAAHITELDWGQQAQHSGLTFTATPARHFSGRSLLRYQSLWSGFVLQSATQRLFLGGDSGYGAHFREIGEMYGPFDLAVLECGQYNEAWRHIHMMPEQTVLASIDLRARVLFPVHWGKFRLALHDWKDPIDRVVRAASERGVMLTIPRLGQPIHLEKELPFSFWWRPMA